MKKTMKIIVTFAVILTLACTISVPAFADFMSPYGWVQVNADGSRVLYLDDGTYMIRYPDGSVVRHDPCTGETTATTNGYDRTTYYADGSVFYENGGGMTEYRDADGSVMTEYADGSYTVEEGDFLYHYDAWGNLTGIQYFNGSYYEYI